MTIINILLISLKRCGTFSCSCRPSSFSLSLGIPRPEHTSRLWSYFQGWWRQKLLWWQQSITETIAMTAVNNSNLQPQLAKMSIIPTTLHLLILTGWVQLFLSFYTWCWCWWWCWCWCWCWWSQKITLPDQNWRTVAKLLQRCLNS